MIVRFILILSVSLLFSISSAFSQTEAAESDKCSSCYSEKSELCQKNCQTVNTPQGQQYCSNSCLRSACVTICGAFGNPNKAEEGEALPGLQSHIGVSGGSAFKEHSGECGRCLRRQEFGECRLRCSKDKVENVTSCRRLCAKGLCANQCSLPASELRRKEKRITKEDCGDCKVSSQTYCYDRCGNKHDRPGYMSCHVSCVQERCSEICNPEPQGSVEK